MKRMILMALAMALTALTFPLMAQDDDDVYINAGFNDTWYDLDNPGQGFGITVYPDSGQVFMTMFTFDTVRPAEGVMAMLGGPGQRWVSAIGTYSRNIAVLDIEVTVGGIFNSNDPMPTQSMDGTFTLEFSSCKEGIVTFDITSIDLQGVIPIVRPANDNVSTCEENSVLTEDEEADLTACESTADKMFLSCRYETKEEFYAVNANCINFGDVDERTACQELAQTALDEETEECDGPRQARLDLCELLGEDIYDPEALLDTANFLVEPDDRNPFFSLEPGNTYVARAGEDFSETIVVYVTEEVREIVGVNCRIVVDVVLEEDDEGELEAVEVTHDYYAQALNGDIHYCGEVSQNFEDGVLVDLDGSFEAGRNYAKSGILIKAEPVAGFSHRQEFLPGEAEDAIIYLAGANSTTSVGAGEGGENPLFPCNGGCVKTEEFIPPEPSSGEYKYFIEDVGFVLGVGLEEGEPTGERDELLCTGDSLVVLEDAACGIDSEDLAAVLDQLCKLAPIAFCEL